MNNYCISVDWLQVCCSCNGIKESVVKSANYTFQVRLSKTQTAMFCNLWKVYSNGFEVAHIQNAPRSSKLNKRLTLIKIENRVLYSAKYIELLYELMGALKCTYKGITRIDLCYDCNKYFNGRSPSRFINQFISKGVGKKGYIYRVGSDRFAAYGCKNRTSSAKVSSIRFGSEKSRIGAYIYDKTIELEEVKDKPWIRQMWEENGIVSNEKEHVFRSEISIKAQGTDILNMCTGELFRLSPNYLEHYENLRKIFHFYAKKYFDFRICNGQKNKRNYDQMQIFECDTAITCKPFSINKCADTGRMEKICYNKIKTLSETYTDLAEPRRKALQCALDFLQELSGIKMGKVTQEHYKEYLSNLKGQYFYDWHTLAYLATVEEARKSKIELQSMEFYAMYKNATLQDMGIE